jgi:hypothetical protein
MALGAEQRAVSAIARLDHAGPETTAESRLIDAFRQLDGERRAYLVALVHSSGQTERVAAFAERCADAGAIDDGLTAIAMLSFSAAPGPLLRALGKLHACARRLAIDPRASFQRAARLALPETATLLERFLQPA